MSSWKVRSKSIAIAFLLALSFTSAESQGNSKEPDLLPLMNSFISSLDQNARSKALLPYDAPGRLRWARSPEQREGLAIREMSVAQTRLLDQMLKSVLSEQGFRRAKAIMSDQDVLAKTEEGLGAGYYWLAIYGEPGSSGPWAWRIGGHHLSLHFTYVHNELRSCVPAFFGAEETLPPNNPKEVGYKLLLPRKDLAQQLIASMRQEQLQQAIIARQLTRSLIVSEDRKLALTTPTGLPVSEFDENQKTTFLKLIEDYAGVFGSEVATTQLRKIRQTALTNIYFGWAGSRQGADAEDYYRIQGPDFLIEYSNTGRHLHSVWRELNDFGNRP